MDNQQASDRPDNMNPANNGADDSPPIGTWIGRNLTWVVLGAAALGVLTYVMGQDGGVWDPKKGLEGVWAIGKVALGLSLIIFVHELGHFVIAKLCDVHVQTFSLGFGPAIPGCSFRWGETLYKIALLPLGGYVKMVGEGDGDEGDDDPRSFKNKSVGQRMGIISAGVIMNVILACVLFVIAFNGGVEKPAGVVGATEPGSPAWKKGVRSGMLFQQVGGVKDPTFEDLRFEVMLSSQGSPISLVGCEPDGQPRRFEIEPRRDPTDKAPVIGVAPAATTKLYPELAAKVWKIPGYYNSPAAAARELDLRPGDRLLAATDKEGHISELSADRADAYALFGRRLSSLIGKPVKVVVNSGGAKQDRDLPTESGFQFDDEIIATTDASPANQPYDPYRLADLPKDSFRDPEGNTYDVFELGKRLRLLAGKPLVLVVRRQADAKAKPTDHKIFVPPAFHYGIPGVRMGMGRVVALRDGSPGEKAGVRPEDILYAVEMTDKKTGEHVRFTNAPDKNAAAKELDPLRLPTDLRRWAQGRSDVEVSLTVRRVKDHEDGVPVALDKVAWDSSWQFDKENARGASAPIAIPELGIAYQVTTTVEHVADDSPARKTNDREGLAPTDVILEVSIQQAAKPDAEPEWTKTPIKLWTDQKTDKQQPEPWWASMDELFQSLDFKKIKVKVKRDNAEMELALEPEAQFPSDELGLRFTPQLRLQKATSLANAIGLGMKETYARVIQSYLSLKSVVTGRVSFFENVTGPIGIAVISYQAARADLNAFLLLLGLISISLAVVNFLPIPVLDGGHMVFLIYEKIRGKPASEQVRTYATIAGFALIVSLVLVVSFLDVKKLAFWL